jgi:hypothetical protein
LSVIHEIKRSTPQALQFTSYQCIYQNKNPFHNFMLISPFNLCNLCIVLNLVSVKEGV